MLYIVLSVKTLLLYLLSTEWSHCIILAGWLVMRAKEAWHHISNKGKDRNL